MKLTSLLLLIFCLVTSLNAQTLSADFHTDNKALNTSQFPLQSGLLTSTEDVYQFGSESAITIANPVGFSVSDDGRLIGSLQTRGGLSAVVYNSEGIELLNTGLQNISSSDETIGFNLLNTGEFIVRDNVANFSFFDATGSRASTYSNSASTAGGEQTSQIAVSDDGVIKVVYNPVIQYQNSQGSRISLVTGDNEAEEFFNVMDRVIISLAVSESDHTISVITQKDGGSRSLHWFDRFGNLLFEMDSDMAIEGFSMSSDGDHVTIYAGNRVQVYNTATTERLGSASSRSSIVKAAYFPDSNLILTLGGNLNDQKIGSPDITAINLQKRQIERVRLSETVMFMDPADIIIERESANTFKIGGINRPIQVTAQF